MRNQVNSHISGSDTVYYVQPNKACLEAKQSNAST